MAQLWGGRFTKETDQLVYQFNASLSFDQRLYKEDIAGSRAHVRMLAAQGILTEDERDEIVKGLDGIEADIESGKLVFSEEYEDIHSFVEANLIDRIGDTGKKLHTGRSRNDQVALDMRLYTRSVVNETDHLLQELLRALLTKMEENLDTVMPGFTHLQKAQPLTLAHHLGAYYEMFRRDRSRMRDIAVRMNECPLGAGALAGTTYPLDRKMTAAELGFFGPTRNSMDSVSDRDYLIEYLSGASIIMNKETNKIVAGPDIVSRGFVYVRESEELMEEAKARVLQALRRCTEEKISDWSTMKINVKEALAQFLFDQTRRRPMILPIIMEV